MATQRYHTSDLEALLRSQTICTMEEMKAALGTDFDLTVLRKLKELPYRTSYSHRGKYYALAEAARYDARGLWFCGPARFSQHGTLVDTVEHFVLASEAGCSARELKAVLGVEVKEPLLKLYRDKRIIRGEMSGVYIYGSKEASRCRKQFQSRRLNAETIFPTLGAGPLPIGDEAAAALRLFLSALNEKQKRLYVGLESLLLGRGGDRKLSQLLELEVKTIARGRRELILRDVDSDRIRKPGGGRKLFEKKRQA